MTRSRFAAGLLLMLAVSVTGTRPQDAALPRLLSAAGQAQTAQDVASGSEHQKAHAAYALSPERAAQAIAYARANHALYFLDFLYSVLALVLILRWRVAPLFRDWAERAARKRFWQAVIFASLLLVTFGVLSLPGEMVGHSLARHFGQSIQGWGSWLWDWSKGELLGIAVGILLVWGFYGLMRRSLRRWWLYAWIASLPLIIFSVFVEPLVVEPLFFRFTPLAQADPQLAAQLERVVAHAGQHIPESRMYLMNASSKLNELNAYVTGLGSSGRVVVWDTTLARLNTPQILFVFGHEMGHYVLGHIRDGIVFSAGLLLIFLFAGFYIFRWALRRFGGRWAIRGAGDWASLPLLVLLILLFDFVFTPLENAYSRHIEHQADQYGLEVVHGIVPNAPEVAAQSFQILGDVDLEEPSPSWAVKVWFYTHPPIAERIEFARTYDPWANGGSPAFVK